MKKFFIHNHEDVSLIKNDNGVIITYDTLFNPNLKVGGVIEELYVIGSEFKSITYNYKKWFILKGCEIIDITRYGNFINYVIFFNKMDNDQNSIHLKRKIKIDYFLNH